MLTPTRKWEKSKYYSQEIASEIAHVPSGREVPPDTKVATPRKSSRVA